MTFHNDALTNYKQIDVVLLVMLNLIFTLFFLSNIKEPYISLFY